MNLSTINSKVQNSFVDDRRYYSSLLREYVVRSNSAASSLVAAKDKGRTIVGRSELKTLGEEEGKLASDNPVS